MINFFRKIRKKLADNNQFLKYSRYAIGEIALVMIGILLALQVNNWNTNRINSNKEIIFLNRLKNDVSEQIEVLELQVKICDMFSVHSDSILVDYKALKDFTKIDNIDKRLSHLMKTTGFRNVNTTFKELNSTGQLSLIKNSEITTKIIEFYKNIDGVELSILSNKELVYYPHAFPIFLEAINLNAENFVGSKKGFTSNFQSEDTDKLIATNLEDPDFKRKLLNAISVVIMINQSVKSSAQSSIRAGEELLTMIK